MAPLVASSLERLLAGREPAAAIAIEASLLLPSLPWVRRLLAPPAPSTPAVLVLVCFQSHPRTAASLAPAASKTHIIDVRPSLLGSRLSSRPHPSLGQHQKDPLVSQSTLDDLPKALDAILASYPNERATIVLDAVDSLLLEHSVQHIAATLRRLIASSSARETTRIIIQYNNDTPILKPHARPQASPFLQATLVQLANAYISLSPSDVGDHSVTGRSSTSASHRSGLAATASKSASMAQSAIRGNVTLILKKRSGKVVREPDYSNLPFNLSLTDQQREQRSQVVLPYMAAQKDGHATDDQGTLAVIMPGPKRFGSRSTTSVSSSTSAAMAGGLIHYQPDEHDDYDDEDPDEDLDL
ncbi:hypothetical protein BC831DRAFT_439457 [Entophlyctis helioformis]|nr:hypothetical protein BC831DRAFT_439457 [Entophlyctis helioformis]